MSGPSEETPDAVGAPVGATGHPHRKIRVAVVFGGRSSEHAVSCATAGSVLAAIDATRYDVVPVGIARDGRWVLESSDAERLRITSAAPLPSVDADRTPVALARVEGGTDLVVQEASAPPRTLGEVDVVFPLLHGPWGEDGTIQGMLEMAGVRYVGAGVLASAVGMDKAYMKVVLHAAGLPVMPGVTVERRRWEREPGVVRAQVEGLGLPLFVKPARGGSSIGISKVHTLAGLEAALETAFAHDPKVLVESSAEHAREIECGALEIAHAEGGGCETSVPAEISVTGEHEFYDFAAKYLPEEATDLVVPAVLPEGTTERVRDLASRAFTALGCEGLARVDFFLLPDGTLVLNEINTMPGFTPLSMYPRMWAATGLDYPALVDRLLSLALARDTGLR